MTDFDIIQADVMAWAREYDGPKFHAMLWSTRGVSIYYSTASILRVAVVFDSNCVNAASEQ